MIEHLAEPDAIREVTREILARPEFVSASAENWMVEWMKTVLEWSKSFGDWAARHPTEGLVAVILMIIVLIALLAHMVYVAFGDVLFGGKRKSGGGGARSNWEILEGAAANWQSGLLTARGALAGGDHRRALWLAHRVLLGLLDERGAIRFSGAKTNSDYLRECPSENRWHPTLVQLTGLYDRVVYGHRPSPAEAVAAALGKVEECRQEASHG